MYEVVSLKMLTVNAVWVLIKQHNELIVRKQETSRVSTCEIHLNQ